LQGAGFVIENSSRHNNDLRIFGVRMSWIWRVNIRERNICFELDLKDVFLPLFKIARV
jgi:hypothetical protein